MEENTLNNEHELEMVEGGSTEPMDELLAELLAQDDGLDTTWEAAEQADTPVPEPVLSESLEPVEAAALAAAEPDRFEILESEETVPAEPPLEAAASDLEVEAPEELEFALEAASVDTDAAEPAALEAAGLEEEPPPPSFAAVPPAPSASSQPALEAVIQTLDEELERAPVLERAAPVTPAHKQLSQLDDYVVFSLSGGDYAVPVRHIAEIGRIPAVTRVPNTPEFIRGITNIRGEVVPVLNLQALLGMQDSAATPRSRVLFLHGQEKIAASALLVDEVKGIQRIQSQQLEQVTGLVDDKVTTVLRGVYGRGDRLLNILDLGYLFELPELRQLESR